MITGCNGAGKTTASFTILPEILNCKEFVNADEITKGLSSFQPAKVAFEVGEIMLSRIENLFKNEESFAFETTLETKSYRNKITKAKRFGYQTTLLFFGLKNVELAKERLKGRVREGGHNIPEEVVERRYINGIINLFDIYLKIVDQILIFDNSQGHPIFIAEKNFGEEIIIHDTERYNKLKQYYDTRS
ncbi:zeta toxin family protein [Myroides sp. LJL115]